MAGVVDFSDAMKAANAANRRHLILGNGFSIALKPDIFTYQSLYKNVDFTDAPHLPAIFEALETHDFETVIRSIQIAAKILSSFGADYRPMAEKLGADAKFLKNALVNAVAKRHPDRPYDIEPEQYAACRRFLSHFDHIYTLNYDVLLYWALMQTEVDDLNIRPDDGFRHPEGDEGQPYVSWQQAHSPTVSYLHGALHLFDNGIEIIKYTWSKTDIPIVDQIRMSLEIDNFPLFVSEGSSNQKWERILHNAYLHKAIRSLESCCTPATAAIFVFGHSLAANDLHVFRQVAKGAAANLFVSLFGDPLSAENQEAMANAKALVSLRYKFRPNRPLNVTYYNASSAHVWG